MCVHACVHVCACVCERVQVRAYVRVHACVCEIQSLRILTDTCFCFPQSERCVFGVGICVSLTAVHLDGGLGVIWETSRAGCWVEGGGAADGFGEIVGSAQGRARSPACREDSGGEAGDSLAVWRYTVLHTAGQRLTQTLTFQTLCVLGSSSERNVVKRGCHFTQGTRTSTELGICVLEPVPCGYRAGGDCGFAAFRRTHLGGLNSRNFLPPGSGGRGPGPGCRRGWFLLGLLVRLQILLCPPMVPPCVCLCPNLFL